MKTYLRVLVALCAILFAFSACNILDDEVLSETEGVSDISSVTETGSDLNTDSQSETDSETDVFSDTDTIFETESDAVECTHTDADDNGKCDSCTVSVLVPIDIYAINDLHGKFDDTDKNEGVDELTTYLKYAQENNPNTLLLSTGDMWQGSSESNMTKGLLLTDWMNSLGFASMTLGNHEYDWGEEYIEINADAAEFPFLAINIYEHADGTLADYCSPSVTVSLDGIEVGIIGAMGDCYSSIAGDKSEDVYFKVGDELTELVIDEAERLRDNGVDLIIYTIHDGYGSNKSSTSYVSDSAISSYYDVELSEHVDVVFEGHTHRSYVLRDSAGVYHLQGGGDNDGLSHAEIHVNSVTGSLMVVEAEVIRSYEYEHLDDDPTVDELLEKYADEISGAYTSLGYNATQRNSNEIKQLVADLYYKAGVSHWGDEYDIFLGGGFISVRSPYNLGAGDVTYGDLQSLLPFDNALVLCSVNGAVLKSRFVDTDNDNYYVSRGGEPIGYIDPNKTYYIITDTYCSSYAPNQLTEIESFLDGVYARDLIANYIAEGGLED